MGTTKDKLCRFARAAAVSGLLGVGGVMLTATPAFAGNGSDNGSDAGSDNGSDNGSDTGTDTDTDTDTGTDTDTTDTDLGTTDATDVAAADSSLTTGGLASTGSDSTVPLLLGGTAIAVVVAGRKLLAKA